MHSEQNAVEGPKRLMCSGDEAMGKVHCRDCMEDQPDWRGDCEGLAKRQHAKGGKKRKERAGLDQERTDGKYVLGRQITPTN